MADEIKMDDVGNAETVLVRLINERKSLESAQQVLMTYRMVKGQLEPASRELGELNEMIKVAKEYLAGVQGDVAAMTSKVNAEVARYREKELARVEKEIDKVESELGELKGEYDELMSVKAEEVERYNKEKGEMESELHRVRDELVEVKREHAALAEAMSNAAAFFKVS